MDILLDILLDIQKDIQLDISSDISLDILSDLLPWNPGRFLHCHPGLHSGTGSCTICGFGWAATNPERNRGVCHSNVCLHSLRGWQSARWGVDGAENTLAFLTRRHRMPPSLGSSMAALGVGGQPRYSGLAWRKSQCRPRATWCHKPTGMLMGQDSCRTS